MITIGLTGNSGCGKSEVARALSTLNCMICDCDKIAHDNMLKGGVAYDGIILSFGCGILRDDGEIDRKILSDIVFNDIDKLALLNKITHKYIIKQIIKYKSIASEKNCDFLLIDAPLLIEAGMTDLVDRVWVVTADHEDRIKRIIERDGITRQMAEQRFKNQMPFNRQKKYADIITRTNFETVDDLSKFVINQLYDVLQIKLDTNAKSVINTLNDAGFDAYAVGGCIRDCLMNITPHDWDITTSAQPEQSKKLFKHTVDTGIDHGTITVFFNKEGFELTTFRTGNENDDISTYSDKLACDLGHRDFTINAIAYSPEKGIIDPFGGREDIKNKTIKAVQNPDERFNEDPLRMLRAIRFSASLNFDIDNNTYSSIIKNNSLIKNVSIERIRDEFLKIISTQNCQNIMYIIHTDLYKYTIPVLKDIVPADNKKFFYLMNNMENIPFLRLAWLFKDTKDCENTLKKLRIDNRTISNVLSVIKYINFEVTDEYTAGKLMSMTDLYKYVLKLKKYKLLNYEKSTASIEFAENLCNNIIDNCHKISELDIDGNDLIKLGIQGKNIGITLNRLLDKVLHCPNDNKKEILIKYAKEM